MKCLFNLLPCLLVPFQMTRAQQVSDPQFLPGSADSAVPFSVSVTCATPAASIYYTLDGAAPSPSSLLLPPPPNNKISLLNSAGLKARAFLAGKPDSNIATASYRIKGALAAGTYHALALNKNGTVWSWADQSSGKLGNGLSTTANVLTPTPVLKAAGVPFTNGWDIAAGYASSLVVDSSTDRFMWSFGYNATGQLGDNTTTSSSYARHVLKTQRAYASATASDFLSGISSGSVGRGFALAVETNPAANPTGYVWAWGNRSYGALEDGTTSSADSPRSYAAKVTTSAAGNPPLTGVEQISAGAFHAMALAPTPGDPWGRGQVWIWGFNNNGELAQGNVTATTGRAVQAKLNASTYLNDATKIAAGTYFAAAIRDDGTGTSSATTAWCWGYQTNGALGNGLTAAANVTYPVQVQKAAADGGGFLTGILQMAAGDSHTVALGADGRVWTWGANVDGQLGDGTTISRGYASTVKTSAGVDLGGIVAVAAGGSHTVVGAVTGHGYTLALKADGTVIGWGYNVHGETGKGVASASVPFANVSNFSVAPMVAMTANTTNLIIPAPLILTAVPTASGASVSRVDFYQNGALLGSRPSSPWTWTVTNITAPGLYSFSAVAVDSLGAMSAPSVVSVTGILPFSSSLADTGTSSLTSNANHYAQSASTQIPATPANDQLGVVNANLGVTRDGTANISVPFHLPKGTAGVEPELALSYDSQAGDGYAGVGWTISGFSTITRGGLDQIHDGVSRGPNFTGADSFAFNGERLVRVDTLPLVNGQLQDGAEFRTEINQLSRIRFKRDGTGIGFWEVVTKSGLTYLLGDTAESRVTPGNLEPQTLTWHIRRVKDRLGNYFDFSYERVTDALQVLPKTVKYTGNEAAGLAPYITVTFVYQAAARPDSTSGFRFGSSFTSGKLLDKITVDTDGTVNRTYQLTYANDLTNGTQTSSTSRSHLVSVKEYAGDTTAISTLPTTFSWTLGARGWTAGSTTLYNLPQLNAGAGTPGTGPEKGRMGDQGRQFVDLNGDGLTDIVWRHVFDRDSARNSSETEWEHLDSGVMMNNGNGYTTQTSGLTIVYHPWVSDPNSIVWNTAIYPLTPATSTGSNAWLPPAIMSANDGVNTGAHFIDLDGDGLQDIISNGTFSYGQKGDWTMINGSWNYDANTVFDGTTGGPARHVSNVTGAWLNTGAGWQPADRYASPIALAQWGSPSKCSTGVRLIDLNGDGLMDLLQAYRVAGQTATDPARSRVWMNAGPAEAGEANSNSLSKAWVSSADVSSSARRQNLAILAAAYEKFGKSTAADPAGLDEFIFDYSSPLLAGGREFYDVNGDGLLDFVVARREPSPANTFTYKTYLNTGTGWKQAFDSSKATVTNLAAQWKLPFPLFTNIAPMNNEAGATMVDVNGDGLLDMVQSMGTALDATYGAWMRNVVYLNNGNGWVDASNGGTVFDKWVVPGYLDTIDAAGAHQPACSYFADVNGDALVDFVCTKPGINGTTGRAWAGVWLNNGSGWGAPVSGTYNSVAYGTSIDLGATAIPRYVARGVAVPLDTRFPLPAGFVAASTDESYDFHIMDLDGDGFVDLIRKPATASAAVWLNGSKPEAINVVTSGLGAQSGVDYVRMNDVTPDSMTGKRLYDWKAKPALTGPDDLPPAYPIVESVSSGLLVARQWSENGNYTISGTDNVMGRTYTTHQYGRSRSHITGYGDLGMGWTEEFDFSDGSLETSETSQNFPTIGNSKYSRVSLCLNAAGVPSPIATPVIAKESWTTYSELPHAGVAWRFPYASSATTKDYDLDASVTTVLKQTSVSTTYPTNSANQESNFNLLSQTTILKNAAGTLASSKTTTNSYFADDFTNWKLGQLSTATVTHHSEISGIDGSAPPPDVVKTSSWSYKSDSGQILSETVEPNGSWIKKTYAYDVFGNAIRIDQTALNEAQAPFTSEAYDSRGRFSISSSNALGHTTTRTYNLTKSLLTDTTSPNGQVVHTDYDDFGTALRTTANYGTASAVNSVSFSKNFNTTPSQNSPIPTARYYTVTQTQGSTPGITYFDKFNRAILSESIAFNGETTFTSILFDAYGRAYQQSRPYFVNQSPIWASVEFDRYGRAKKSIAPDGTYTTSFTNGLVVASSSYAADNTLLGSRQGTSDLEGHTISMIEQDIQTLAWKQSGRFTYYADGGVHKVISPDGRTTETVTVPRSATTAQYGVKTTVTDSDSGTSVITYDGFGRVHSSIQSGGATTTGLTTFTYDILGRQITKIASEGTWTNEFDTAPRYGGTFWVGAPRRRTSPGGYTEQIAYDAYGRPSQTTIRVADNDLHDYVAGTTYDALGRVDTSTDFGGFATRQRYNSLGFPDAVLKAADNSVLSETLAIDSQGRVTKSRLGNGVETSDTYDDLKGLLLNSRVRKSSTGPDLQNSSSAYDLLGNLTSRSRAAITGLTSTENQTSSSESFTYDGLLRLTQQTVTNAAPISQTYDAWGNILTKTGVGTYHYDDGAHNCRLTTLTRTDGRTQSFYYDGLGRLTSDAIGNDGLGRMRWLSYNSFGQLADIGSNNCQATTTLQGASFTGMENVSLHFDFDASGNRIRQDKWISESLTSGTYYRNTNVTTLGSYELSLSTLMGRYTEIEERHYFAGGVVRYTRSSPTADGVENPNDLSSWITSLSYYHGDGEGSTEAVTNGSATVTERDSFDAWGKRRDASDWNGYSDSNGRAYASKEKPGYTGHEDLADVGLIHMNGRIYDPELGRFLQVDPILQDPGSCQNFNPYSYVMNNPLNCTDPSGNSWLSNTFKSIGHFFGKVHKAIKHFLGSHMSRVKKIGRWIKKNYRAVITVVVAVVVIVVAWYAAPYVASAVGGAGTFAGTTAAGAVSGAAIGAGVSASTTAIMGGSWRDIGRSALHGAATGAISGALAAGVLHGIDAYAKAAAEAGHAYSALALETAHTVAHGVVGGAMSEAEGGSFKDGFIGSALGAALSPTANHYLNLGEAGTGGFSQIAARTVVAGVIGGTASVASGGKFASGALTAAFLHLFNAEIQKPLEKLMSRVCKCGDKCACTPCPKDLVFYKKVEGANDVNLDFDGDARAYAPNGSNLVGLDVLSHLCADDRQMLDAGTLGKNSLGYYRTYASNRSFNSETTYGIALDDTYRKNNQVGFNTKFLLYNETTGKQLDAYYYDSRGSRSEGIEISYRAAAALGCRTAFSAREGNCVDGVNKIHVFRYK